MATHGGSAMVVNTSLLLAFGCALHHGQTVIDDFTPEVVIKDQALPRLLAKVHETRATIALLNRHNEAVPPELYKQLRRRERALRALDEGEDRSHVAMEALQEIAVGIGLKISQPDLRAQLAAYQVLIEGLRLGHMPEAIELQLAA